MIEKLGTAPLTLSNRILVPVSGGKDSQMCFAMAVDRVGASNVLGVHQHTGFDHPLTYEHMQYMRDRYKAPIIEIKSEKYEDVPDVMIIEMMVPNHQRRSCTRQLKTGPWFRWLRSQPDLNSMLVWLGMRTAESAARRENYGALLDDDIYEMGDISNECPKSCSHVKTQLPIVTASTADVFDFFRKRGDKVNPLYGMGFTRVGCFPCVLAGKGTMKITARDPVGRENLRRIQGAMSVIQWAYPEAYFDHDIDALLSNKDDDPFGFFETAVDDDNAGGCSWCNL